MYSPAVNSMEKIWDTGEEKGKKSESLNSRLRLEKERKLPTSLLSLGFAISDKNSEDSSYY